MKTTITPMKRNTLNTNVCAWYGGKFYLLTDFHTLTMLDEHPDNEEERVRPWIVEYGCGTHDNYERFATKEEAENFGHNWVDTKERKRLM